MVPEFNRPAPVPKLNRIWLKQSGSAAVVGRFADAVLVWYRKQIDHGDSSSVFHRGLAKVTQGRRPCR